MQSFSWQDKLRYWNPWSLGTAARVVGNTALVCTTACGEIVADTTTLPNTEWTWGFLAEECWQTNKPNVQAHAAWPAPDEVVSTQRPLHSAACVTSRWIPSALHASQPPAGNNGTTAAWDGDAERLFIIIITKVFIKGTILSGETILSTYMTMCVHAPANMSTSYAYIPDQAGNNLKHKIPSYSGWVFEFVQKNGNYKHQRQRNTK